MKIFYKPLLIMILCVLSYTAFAQDILSTAPRGVDTQDIIIKVQGEQDKKYFDLKQIKPQSYSIVSNKEIPATGTDYDLKNLESEATYEYQLTFKNDQKQTSCSLNFQIRLSPKDIKITNGGTCGYQIGSAQEGIVTLKPQNN